MSNDWKCLKYYKCPVDIFEVVDTSTQVGISTDDSTLKSIKNLTDSEYELMFNGLISTHRNIINNKVGKLRNDIVGHISVNFEKLDNEFYLIMLTLLHKEFTGSDEYEAMAYIAEQIDIFASEGFIAKNTGKEVIARIRVINEDNDYHVNNMTIHNYDDRE